MHQFEKPLSSDTTKQLQEDELDGEQGRERTANALTTSDSTGNEEPNHEFVVYILYVCNIGCTSSDLIK